jgi:hypothetical protein
MTRQAVRVMKRAIHAGAQAGANDSRVTTGRQSALSLLSRSIGTGATVPAEHWHYCHQAAHASKDESLQVLYLSAARHACVHAAELAAVQ